MKRAWTGILIGLTACGMSGAMAQLQLQPDAQPQGVFGGGARDIRVVWHNAGDQTVVEPIRARIFQATSATAVLLEESGGEKLEVLPRQTVLASATLNFPAVKSETKFVVQWLGGTNPIPGATEVRVYPTNLLAELKPLTDGGTIGVFDPGNELKPLLKTLAVKYEDLEAIGLEHCSGRLAIIGPFESRALMPGDMAAKIKALAKRNVGVVWIPAAYGESANPLPSFYSVMENTNSIIVVQPDLVADLTNSPQAQRNLIYFCRLAVNPPGPESLTLVSQP